MRASILLRTAATASVVALTLAGCDSNPTLVTQPPLNPHLANPADSVISTQGSIRVVFVGSVNQATALDPGNFVVTNNCTGLPVPGSLRFVGDTLVFTPSQTLPFLTALTVRVQGVLDASDNAMKQPVIIHLRTQNPPVSDVSWAQLASPTNDFIAGVSFVDPDFGFISTITGGVYRTDNGGQSFAAFFKSADVISTFDIRLVSKDSMYMVGAPSFGGTRLGATALFRSIDGGHTFDTVFTENSGNMFSLSLLKRTGAAPLMVMGGSIGSMVAWRFDQQNDSIARFGPVGGSVFGNMADISPNGANAALVGVQLTGPQSGIGVAYGSTDGGRTYTPITLPANTHILDGLGFINNTDAFLLGDTSAVLRVNVTTGAVTSLGAANGIPQTESDPATGSLTVYFFTRARFTPDDPNVGWIIGTVVRRVPGLPDVRRGIILITRDGGQTFTRQAVSNAPENGLGFPELRDISVLSKNFAVVAGGSGFIAARKSDTQNFAQLCSFTAQ
ncbi:MAG TPA: hypothetical protein VGH98_03215 [Gemmatimonadaceae bacterium]|jgi:photosystem II stability/assembly factor-like uncharacterized protein